MNKKHITVFGTCRLGIIENCTNLHKLISFTHTTKETLQLIKCLNNELIIPPEIARSCFRTPFLTQACKTDLTIQQKKDFQDSAVFLIEICSKKTYMYDSYYLHRMCVRKRNILITPDFIMNNHSIIPQSDIEIEEDILLLQKLLHPRKLILVSHFNVISPVTNNVLPARDELIQLLRKISVTYNIPLIEPAVVLKDYKQSDIVHIDLQHYEEYGLSLMSKYLNDYLKNYMKLNIC